MVDESNPIEYRFLNMDAMMFVKDAAELSRSLGVGSLIRAIPNWQHNQVLYAGGRRWFSESQAIQLCKRISNV